ncbi:Phosphoenolpyruvate synthase [Candidatus Norongarragalina meridionalis]|nr:Phosphoenolpyruvate synthase [Candidatus Norongarragalina meridionalis]
MRVGLCAIDQKMVDSEKSGIMFTADPMTEDRSAIVIEAGFGLGEAIVSGMVTPDRYIVDRESFAIREKDIAKQDIMIVRAANGGDDTIDVPEEMREAQKITDDDIVALAKIGRKLDEHYAFPQDVEWAIEKGKCYIVQTRAITTLGKKKKEEEAKPAAASSSGSGEALLRGMGASPGVASGPVKIVMDASEIDRVLKGDVLVAHMTSPDYVPAMKRAAAIVTDAGGMTCHAAIVSRELGVPCIVGTKEATSKLKDGQVITVDAKRGIVYDGEVAIEGAKSASAPANDGQQATVVNVTAAPSHVVTGTKIYVNIAETEKAEEVGAKDCDGVGLLRAEFMIAGLGVHPKKLVAEHREQEFIDALANGLRTVCSAFYPRPVIYRATDFKTNEYRNLEGGAEYEPQEENPMIGYRGCFRYVKDPDVFRMELRAIKKVREEFGMKNLWLMIPFVRTLHELEVCKKLTEEEGLPRSYDFKFGIMCEVPSTVVLAEEFCGIGIDFMSIGSNDLTQLTLGVDRDSTIVAEDFDERDPSIMKSVKAVIDGCHKHGVRVGICGQAPSVYPEFAEALVEYGIDSISVNPDVIEVTRRIVASAEMKALLKKARS